MKKLFLFLFLVLGLAFALSVFIKSGDGKKDIEGKKDIVSTPVGDLIVVRINGKDLTRGDVIRNGKVLLQLNMNKARRRKIRNREIRALERYCRSAVEKEIARNAVVQYIKEKNISVSTGTLARVTRRFESQYGVLSRKLKRRHNVNDLKFMLGKNAFRLDEMIMETALYDTMTNDVIRTANLNVSEEQIAKRLQSIKNGNERASVVSREVFEKATNVWKQITSGKLTFEAAASKFSEDEYIKEGCDWGCFTMEQLEGEDMLLALLPNLKTGDITPPLESDGGVAILRKDEDDNNSTYSFSRVFFRLPYFYEEETPEQAREYLKKRKSVELIKSVINENISKLKIEYPNGTNMVWKITGQDFK